MYRCSVSRPTHFVRHLHAVHSRMLTDIGFPDEYSPDGHANGEEDDCDQQRDCMSVVPSPGSIVHGAPRYSVSKLTMITSSMLGLTHVGMPMTVLGAVCTIPA